MRTPRRTWATAVEAVGLFTREALKSNIGNEDWLRLFALMSSQIAMLEKTAIVAGTPHDSTDRIREIRELEAKLRAVRTLNAYSLRLIPLYQVHPYLVVGRSRRHDFGPRFVRGSFGLGAFPPPFFCDAEFA